MFFNSDDQYYSKVGFHAFAMRENRKDCSPCQVGKNLVGLGKPGYSLPNGIIPNGIIPFGIIPFGKFDKKRIFVK